MQGFDLERLAQSGLVQRMEFHQTLASTNDRAAELAADEQLACPALVLTAEQTAGRGRGGNHWWSTAGSLMFSLVLQADHPQRAPANWAGYSLTAGLAICEALAAECPTANLSVKWPNDVFANGRKIAGLLLESPAQARGRLIVGIGANINNSTAGAAQEIARTAVACCELDGGLRDLTNVLLRILASLDSRWRQLHEQGWESLGAAWSARSLLTNRTVRLQIGAQQHLGRCLGIDAEGALILQTETARQVFPAGSIVHFE